MDIRPRLRNRAFKRKSYDRTRRITRISTLGWSRFGLCDGLDTLRRTCAWCDPRPRINPGRRGGGDNSALGLYGRVLGSISGYGSIFGAARRVFKILNPFLERISFFSGVLIIVVGILIFTNSLINLNTVFTFIEVDQVSGSASLGIVGLAVAFGAGIVSVFSPCVLPMVPVYMLYITGSSVDEKGELASPRSPFAHSLAFVVGFGVIFIVLGASVGLIGTILRDDIFNRFAGALLIVLGLSLAGVLNIPFLQIQRRVVNA